MKNKTVFLVLLAIFLAACGVHVTFNTDTDKIYGAANQIADFDLPTGYCPDFTASLNDYTLVSYTPGDNHSHLYLIQSQNATDADNLEKVLNDLIERETVSKDYVTVLETRSVIVRDQETTFIISEATNGERDRDCQALVAFTGKGGPALLEYSTPLEN